MQLVRANVQAIGKNIVSEPSTNRIGKYAWFDDFYDKTIADMSKRVGDMTGLTMNSAEALQVVNYGIGGFYSLHFDFAIPGDDSYDKILGLGNRIATVLFYVRNNLAL